MKEQIQNDMFGEDLPWWKKGDHPPNPPTGPEAVVPSKEDGRYPAYIEWLDSDEGRAFWHALNTAARAAYKAGESRFSTRTYVARYRDDNKVKINDHYTAWLADDLATEHPDLLDIIERRVRKKGKE